MPELTLVVFDDLVAQRWEPFALTRPAGELLFGTLTLRRRAERVFGAPCRALLSADHLVGFAEEDSPPVAPLSDPPDSGDRLFWLSRAVPDWGAAELLAFAAGAPGAIRIGDRIAGWFAPAGTPAPAPEFLLEPRGPAAAAVPGRVLDHVWELISGNAAQVARDVAALHPAPPEPELHPSVLRWGEHPLIVSPGARLEPGCAIETVDGPVWIDDGAEVRAFTRLAGPVYVGPGSRVMGGTVRGVSIGPACRVRGELAESVCLGFTNKQHHGHIGHSYVGRWVNLGAGTTNSDLKNNYGTVRIWTPEGEVDTGEVKMGCLLGDHVKTGIGTLIATGTVIGAGSNLFGVEMPPKHVPPFSWGTADELVEYRLEKFLEVAERVMKRRDEVLTPSMRDQLARSWERARGAGNK